MRQPIVVGPVGEDLQEDVEALCAALRRAQEPVVRTEEIGPDLLPQALRDARLVLLFVGVLPAETSGADAGRGAWTLYDAAIGAGAPVVVFTASPRAFRRHAPAAPPRQLDLRAEFSSAHRALVYSSPRELAQALRGALLAAGAIHEPVDEALRDLHHRSAFPGLEEATPQRGMRPHPAPDGESRQVAPRLSRAPAMDALRQPDLLAPDEMAFFMPTPDSRPSEVRAYEPRFVNLDFACRGEPLARDRRLERATDYDLRVRIGPEADGITRSPGPLPPQAYAREGQWLDVVAVSATLNVRKRRQAIFLPWRGSAWTCPCPRGTLPHACRPQDRRHEILFPVRTPAGGAAATLRVLVCARNNVLESQLVRVELGEGASEDAQRADTDYTLTGSVADADSLPQRDVAILTNDEGGTHRIVIVGDGGPPLVWHLPVTHVSSALHDLRWHLMAIHLEDPGAAPDANGGLRGNRLGPRNEKDAASFAADLRTLARRGSVLLADLMGRAEDEAFDTLDGLGQGPPRKLQVARVRGTGVAYPWSFLYGIPLDRDESRWVDCRVVREPSRLADPTLDECPEGPHEKNVICPFGFWGVRHVIEQPPSSDGWDLPPRVRAPSRGALLARAAHPRLDAAIARAHDGDLRALAPRLEVREHAGRAGVEQALREDALGVLYFYCHGREEKEGSGVPTVCLVVGDDESVSPADVVTWARAGSGLRLRERWRTLRPLVFINGCNSVRVTPEIPGNFVDGFGRARAGGVIGTEIPVSQAFASEAGAVFLRAFSSGATVGEAMRALRRHFLSSGNVLGLAYTAYSFADLKLQEASP